MGLFQLKALLLMVKSYSDIKSLPSDVRWLLILEEGFTVSEIKPVAVVPYFNKLSFLAYIVHRSVRSINDYVNHPYSCPLIK